MVATLALLEGIYRQREIESIVADAGLPLGKIAWDSRPELTWRSVVERAAATGTVPALLKTVAESHPSLRERIDEIWADDALATPLSQQPQPHPQPQPQPSQPAPQPLGEREWVNFSDSGQDEALISGGRSPFLDITFLAEGLRRARSVCRLDVRHNQPAWATGFRVGPDEVLTAFHAVHHQPTGRFARRVEAVFAIEDDGSGRPGPSFRVRCVPQPACGEQSWDWAVLRTETLIPEEFPALRLGVAAPPEVDDRVYVVQHPGGGPKKIALAHNLVRFVDDVRVQYWANTDRGSSGAPVFDENWDVVAMHHKAFHRVAGDAAGTRNQGVRTDLVARRIAICCAGSPAR